MLNNQTAGQEETLSEKMELNLSLSFLLIKFLQDKDKRRHKPVPVDTQMDDMRHKSAESPESEEQVSAKFVKHGDNKKKPATKDDVFEEKKLTEDSEDDIKSVDNDKDAVDDNDDNNDDAVNDDDDKDEKTISELEKRMYKNRV